MSHLPSDDAAFPQNGNAQTGDASVSDLFSEGDLNITPARKEWSDSNIDEESRRWLQEDEKYFLHQSLSTPCLDVLERSEGACTYNMQGKRFLDFHGNNVHQVGFKNPKVMEAVRNQMETMPFCPRRFTNIPAISLAKKLTELAPGDLNRVLFAPGGASAMGMALKLARAATGKFKTISMWDSFHGAALDTISIGGEAIFRKNAGPLLPGCEHVPPSDPKNCPFKCGSACNLNCADYIEYVLEKEGDIAAVVSETVRSTPFIPPKDYWTRVRKACDKHGALLILDEIPHCLGRTGKMFTCQNYDVIPDMLVIGKGLGGAIFPLAALLASEELNKAMPEKALGHYTHEKNPVACAAGLATLEYIEENQLLDHVNELGSYALGKFHDMKQRIPGINDVRGLGLMMGLELGFPDQSEEYNRKFAEAVLYRCLSQGLSFKISMGVILTLTPALTITQSEMDEALHILEDAIAQGAPQS